MYTYPVMKFSNVLAISSYTFSDFGPLVRQNFAMWEILASDALHSLIMLCRSLMKLFMGNDIQSRIILRQQMVHSLRVYLYGYLFVCYSQKQTIATLGFCLSSNKFFNFGQMQRLQEKFTPLLPLILPIIKQYNSKEQLQRVIFDQKLKLAIIEKSPNTCLSDFRNSIQASTSQKEIFRAYPFNRNRSNYYTLVEKSWVSLNAPVKYLKEPKDYPSPYEPYFHFKKNYDEYLDTRPTLNFRCECQAITVYSWSLKVVNISNTGYYCVIMHILDSRRTGERFVENVGYISSILYEPEIQYKMESLRLMDLRNSCKQAKDGKVPFSLFYYCRDSQSHIKRRPNNIIVLDNAQKYLKYDSKQPYSIVSFGQVEGISTLQYPLKSAEINIERIQALHTQNIDVFFNYAEKKDEKATKKSNRPELWSSESQSQSSYHSQEESSDNAVIEDVDSQESNEDPLRNLYIKQFQNMKMQ